MADMREDQRRAFLAGAGFAAARRVPLAGDASARRYERIWIGGTSALLMDCPPHADEDTRLFLDLSRWLAGLGLSTAEILAEDADAGLVLLEDFGPDRFAETLRDASPDALYAAAIDVLDRIQRAALPDSIPLPPYDLDFAVNEAALVFDWYMPDPPADLAGAVAAALRAHLAPSLADPVVVLRDYHAENLFWLPQRDGTARVGLIDYQGARIGARAYDLAALLTDARRDVAPDLAAFGMRHFCAVTGADREQVEFDCAAWAVQRNLKILGLFARLHLRDGKSGYLDLLPRVWRYLQADLGHPALADLADLIGDAIPVPDPDFIARLRRRAVSDA